MALARLETYLDNLRTGTANAVAHLGSFAQIMIICMLIYRVVQMVPNCRLKTSALMTIGTFISPVFFLCYISALQ